MFSKALFKQSCKANGTMWAIITFAVCFMLACVMLISGSGSLGEVKNAIQDTIIVKEVDSAMEKRAVGYFINGEKGVEKFDEYLASGAKECFSYLEWIAAGSPAEAKPSFFTTAGKTFEEKVEAGEMSANKLAAIALAYGSAATDTQTWIKQNFAPTEEGAEDMSLEYYGVAMCAVNPNGQMNAYYQNNGESLPGDYDVSSVFAAISAGNDAEYLASEERAEYRKARVKNAAPVFLAANMTSEEVVDKLVENLASFKVTKEKYEGFGYTYAHVKNLGMTAIITFSGRIEYETELIMADFAAGKYESEQAAAEAVTAKAEEIESEITSSLLSSLPEEVSSALEEIGMMDLYTLVVGSIFYKLAGLLLPIIYMIMASNNLIAGQVDSGSMAYVLSTSTKRKTVVFTQAIYLIGSLLGMFVLTTATGCVCLAIVSAGTAEVELTYAKLLLLNLGAFLVLLALSGLCFFTSCLFDRSKRSMAIGGGLSIFALVAAMLGLFGSPVIPSVVRLSALNYFNYATVISLFDVVSIMEGTTIYLWKFAILAVAGIAGYIVGEKVFVKKDLPL